VEKVRDQVGWAVSQGRGDVGARRDAAGPAERVVIPNGVDLARFTPEIERPGQRLLFVGSFRHFPNIIAYRFFVEQVWPILLETFPETTLTVVAGPDPLLYWREHTGLLSVPLDDRNPGAGVRGRCAAAVCGGQSSAGSDAGFGRYEPQSAGGDGYGTRGGVHVAGFARAWTWSTW